MATTHAVIRENPRFTVIKQTVDHNDGGSILRLDMAKTLYVVADGAIIFNVPQVSAAGVPTDDPSTADAVELPASEDIIAPTASTAGRISENCMPLFLQIGNTSGATRTLYVYIIHSQAESGLSDVFNAGGASITNNFVSTGAG